MAINNTYLDFVETHGLISLVNYNHVDNNLKEILVYVHFGSIVNNQPKNDHGHFPIYLYIFVWIQQFWSVCYIQTICYNNPCYK